jgi:hypothetical protein
VALISVEGNEDWSSGILALDPEKLGPFSDLQIYIMHRQQGGRGIQLPELPVPVPVPEEFKQVFRDWAEGKVNFVGPTPDSADSGSQ